MLLTFGHVAAAVALTLGLTISSFANADYQDTIAETFEVNPGGTLVVDADTGSITVRTTNTNEVNVTIQQTFRTNDRDDIEEVLDRLDIDLEKHGNDVVVSVELDRNFRRYFWNNGRQILHLDIEVTVPQKYNADLRTSDDDIKVGDLAGSVECRTSDGNIHIGNIDGSVRASTSDGDIELDTVTGPVTVKTSDGNIDTANIDGTVEATTSDGDIEIGHAVGWARVKTSDGDIRLMGVEGAIDAKTSDGDITAAISDQPDRDCTMTTSDGNITVHLDPSCRLSINAHVGDGEISAEGLTVRLGRRDKRQLSADLNGGGPELFMRTSDGDIRIRER